MAYKTRAELKAEITTLTTELKSAQVALSAETAKDVADEKTLAACNAKVKTLQASISTTQAALAALNVKDQANIAALANAQANLTQAQKDLATAKQALADAQATVLSDEAQLKSDEATIAANETTISNAVAQHTADEATIAQLQQELAAFQNPPTPPSPAATCVFGSTPYEGSTAKDVADMDAKYGMKVPVTRLYWQTSAGPSPISDRPIVGSFKTMSSSTTAWANTMYRWAFQHEIDSKVHKGTYDLATWQTNMNALVKLGVPGLSVIVTGEPFIPNSGRVPTTFIIDGVTHWGVDLDGISPSATSTAYHDYTAEIDTIAAFMEANGYTWGVPELGANLGAFDPDGSKRGAWFTKTAEYAASKGAEYVCVWEYVGQDGSEITLPAEIAALSKLFKSTS